jgi:hypothetical protein
MAVRGENGNALETAEPRPGARGRRLHDFGWLDGRDATGGPRGLREIGGAIRLSVEGLPFMVGSGLVQHFRLADSTTAAKLEIEWQSGLRQTFVRLHVDRPVVVVRRNALSKWSVRAG